jgi:hypothetical protein
MTAGWIPVFFTTIYRLAMGQTKPSNQTVLMALSLVIKHPEWKVEYSIQLKLFPLRLQNVKLSHRATLPFTVMAKGKLLFN